MRISVIHTTVFRYEQPVLLEPHVFRLRPREDGTQRLVRHYLELLPEAYGRSQFLDQDGNAAEQAWFREPLSELIVRSSFEVETSRANPFDFLLPRSEDMRLPLAYRESEQAALAAYLTPPAASVIEYARSIAAGVGRQAMPFLHALLRDLFDNSTHELRKEGGPHPAEQTLRLRRGSCRDFSVLFCAACRTMGIAARFVSGYETESAFREDSHMHAWAEVYIPGGGWRGYDPSRGVAVSTAHVAVAAAADPVLAAPITGTYRGAAKSSMLVALSMQAAG